MRFLLVLTTGKFFNKVNQAESIGINLALRPLGERGKRYHGLNCSGGDGFQFPVVTIEL